MTLGVAVCVWSQLGSSVISTIPYVMASAGELMDTIPEWTIGTYTILMNAPKPTIATKTITITKTKKTKTETETTQ